MSKLYYSFEWQIKLVLSAGETLWKLTTQMGELDVCMLGTGFRKSPKGYFIVELVMEIPSRERLAEFIRQTEEWIQFTHIRKTDETHFKKGVPLLVPQGITEIVMSLKKAAEYNEDLALYGEARIFLP